MLLIYKLNNKMMNQIKKCHNKIVKHLKLHPVMYKHKIHKISINNLRHPKITMIISNQPLPNYFLIKSISSSKLNNKNKVNLPRIIEAKYSDAF
jgi:hypothetical protein